ncbi:MAG: hypothetical protein ACI9CP_001288 [Cryomorphaceae bacterium]|jgi:hypothetical protein
MRLIALFIISIFSHSSAYSQSSKTIRTFGILKKTETVVKYHSQFEVARYVEEVELYNTEGDWVEKFTYASGGELKLHQKRIYDGDEIIDETAIDLNGSGMKAAKPPSFDRLLYTYERGDLVVEKRVSEGGKVIDKKEFVYNKLGDLVRVTTKDGDGAVVKREAIEYDHRGLKIKESVVDSAGAILKEKTFVYE